MPAAFEDALNGFIYPKACFFSSILLFPTLQAVLANTSVSRRQLCGQMTLNTFPNWSSNSAPFFVTPPSSHFDSHPLLLLSYLLQLLGTISNPVKVVCPVVEPFCVSVICLKITYTCVTVTLSVLCSSCFSIQWDAPWKIKQNLQQIKKRMANLCTSKQNRHITSHNCQYALYFIKQLQQSFVIVTKQYCCIWPVKAKQLLHILLIKRNKAKGFYTILYYWNGVTEKL